MKNIVIAGSINMDIVATLDKYPEKGETVYGKKLHYIPGGKGANQARAIARLGGRVSLIAKVGQDNFAKTLLESLEKDGISTKNVKNSKKSPTGVAIIGIDKDAENRIVIISGANFDLSPGDLESASLTENTIALSQFEIPKDTIKDFFQKAKKSQALTILNPSPITKLSADLIKLVDYLIINEHEFFQLFKIKNPLNQEEKALRAAEPFTAENTSLVVTLGSRGSIALEKGKFLKAEPFSVKSVDTTGAGDSFLGAFSQALAENQNINQALTFANAAAALKVTKLGASSMPFRKEVDELIQKKRND